MKKRNWIKTIALTLVCIVLFAAGFIGYLTVVEWKPDDVEYLTTTGSYSKTLKLDDHLSILTWNVGYAALSEGEDFFMDGGKRIMPESKSVVDENLEGIAGILGEYFPDVIYLQELDKSSKRSYYIDEDEYLYKASQSSGIKTNSSFAYNFRCQYIPYPLPMIGKVDSGILTASTYQLKDPTRIQLSLSYKWPVRIAQIKRCLLVNRIDFEDSDKQLVLINLHMEAYASEDAKKDQIATLKNLVEEEYAKGNYVIAGGDWNMTFPQVDPDLYPVIDASNYVAETMSEDICPEGWNFIFDQITPTCRLLNHPYNNGEQAQYYVIDGFLVSPNVRVSMIETIDAGFKYSDHNPVYMEFHFDNH